jgi:hypothetical protein
MYAPLGNLEHRIWGIPASVRGKIALDDQVLGKLQFFG